MPFHYTRWKARTPLPLDIGMNRRKFVILKNHIDSPPIVRGSYKQIYYAVDLQTFQITMWAKILLQSYDEQYIFSLVENAYNISREINHKGVIKYLHYSVYQTDFMKKASLMMERCNGDLIDLLHMHANIPPPVELGNHYWNIIENVVETMAEMEKKQIQHRDIKPENIFFLIRGNRIKGKLGDLDFAAAKELEIIEEKQKGTSIYFAPEYCKGTTMYEEGKIKIQTGEDKFDSITRMNEILQMDSRKPFRTRARSVGSANDVDYALFLLKAGRQLQKEAHSLFTSRKKDIWSLGVTIWELRTGRDTEGLYQGKISMYNNTEECNLVIEKITQENIREVFSPEISPNSLEELNLRMLSVDPEERPSALECLETIRRLRKDGAKFI